MIEIVGSPRLPGKDISAVTFILKDLQNAAGRPGGVTFLCLPAELRKDIGNSLSRITIEVKEKDEPDSLCFVFINNQISILINVIAEQGRSEKDSAFKTHLNGCVHDFTFGMAFLLSERGNKGKTHLAVWIKRIYVFGFKEDTDGRLFSFEEPDIADAVHDVSGKT